MIRHESQICVFGGTEGALFCAVTAARAGASVAWVCSNQYPWGVLPSLGAWETHYPGQRSPLTAEFVERILAYYEQRYGQNSAEYQCAARLEANNPMITFEPHVAETILQELLNEQSAIQVFRSLRPEKSETTGSELRSVCFRGPAGSSSDFQIRARVFLDASYEGDLAARAGVPFRIGRESRGEFGETHAGKVFSRYTPGKYPLEAVVGRLNLIPKWSTLGLMAGSSGHGDDHIQSYCYRLCLTNDPNNRRIPQNPPANYDPEDYLGILEDPNAGSTRPYALHHRFLLNTLQQAAAGDHLFHGHQLPGGKRSWNATNFTGGGRGYAEADPEGRAAIEQAHLDHALGILYFLQNDPRIPASLQEQARTWGLARDEFIESTHVPPQLYVREARRIHGRTTITEHDCTVAPGLARAPVHSDSIGITEFPIDSLDCTTERRPFSMNDGQFFLMEYSRPGQIPFRCLLPENLDNLMVPVAASASHVAWGSYRQTPTLLHTCESAGVAAALAVELGVAPAQLPTETLQRRLVEWGIMLTFFNDSDMSSPGEETAPIQWLGTRGFFATYDARPSESISMATLSLWCEAAGAIHDGNPIPPNELARRLHLAGNNPDESPDPEAIQQLLGPLGVSLPVITGKPSPPTRGAIAHLLYQALVSTRSERPAGVHPVKKQLTH